MRVRRVVESQGALSMLGGGFMVGCCLLLVVSPRCVSCHQCGCLLVHLAPRPAENVHELCEEQVYNFYINRSKNINANVPLGAPATWVGSTQGRSDSWPPLLGVGASRCAWQHMTVFTFSAHIDCPRRASSYPLPVPAAPVLPLRCAAKACKADAEKLCNSTWFFGPKEGGVIGCLK